MTVEIDYMTEADVAAIEALERACFSEPWSEKSLRESLANPRYRILTAKAEGRLIGYVSTFLVADEMNIANVAVDSEFRRQGVGKRLMDSAVILAKQNRMTTIYLEVRKSNEAAQELYRKVGFERGGVRKNFYDHPKEDGLIMRMDLE